MKKEFVKRLEALEEQKALAQRPVERDNPMQVAIRVGLALREGVEANDELIEADASLDPERRAKLTETLRLARSIATALGHDGSTGQTPIRGSLGALLAALWATFLPPVETRGTRFLRPAGMHY